MLYFVTIGVLVSGRNRDFGVHESRHVGANCLPLHKPFIGGPSSSKFVSTAASNIEPGRDVGGGVRIEEVV